ncbi:MAG: cysteine--tRNA ligase [Bacteroidota bacterium]|nr:cysteine--tRNA ligase [Bacteroidota bacterium]
MPLQLYNTLTRKKELFKPINKNHVGMYVCGPTVYGDPHLGHARPAITFDLLFRYLKHLKYNVRYVRNITDAGHLENDTEGEDKIAKKARIEKLEPMEIVQLYTLRYHESINMLNCLPPSIEPRATGHIIEQIEMVKKILKNKLAYEVNGSVYLDVAKYNKKYAYGQLSGRNLDDTMEGTRVLDRQVEKNNPIDFAIWKKANPEHIMRWPSPWGEGFPGWHMECSAMSEKYLGESFDIHGGGMDLVFPHHEAEITQSNAANNCPPVKYWIHNNMITINGQKMGKSLNNFINLKEFFTGSHKKLEKAYNPMTIRFFILQAHYRSPLDFSNNALQAAEKGFVKLINAISVLNNLPSNKSSTYNATKLEKKCYDAINDDLNTPILIAHLFEGVRIVNLIKDGKEKLDSKGLKKMKNIFKLFANEILGFSIKDKKEDPVSFDGIMQIIIDLRKKAKTEKDWSLADLIRDKLGKLNIKIKDGPNSSSWEIKD